MIETQNTTLQFVLFEDCVTLDKDLKQRKYNGETNCDSLIGVNRDYCKQLSGESVDGVCDFYLPFIQGKCMK